MINLNTVITPEFTLTTIRKLGSVMPSTGWCNLKENDDVHGSISEKEATVLLIFRHILEYKLLSFDKLLSVASVFGQRLLDYCGEAIHAYTANSTVTLLMFEIGNGRYVRLGNPDKVFDVDECNWIGEREYKEIVFTHSHSLTPFGFYYKEVHGK